MTPAAVLVVVPVNNEDALLPRCIHALHAAVHEAGRTACPPIVEVALVLDGCTDRSRAIAEDSGFRVTGIEATSVGVARAHGVRTALARFAATDPQDLWIANTDADSAVPTNWLTTHITAASAGYDLLVGTVRPDFDDLSPAQRTAWTATHTPGVANGHVHGTNLGLRADKYLEVGGFQPSAEHEDVGLVARLRSRPTTRELATAVCCVLTSGRSVGRTPGGYARHLSVDLCAGRRTAARLPAGGHVR